MISIYNVNGANAPQNRQDNILLFENAKTRYDLSIRNPECKEEDTQYVSHKIKIFKSQKSGR